MASTKAALRAEAMARRNALSPEARAAASRRIAERAAEIVAAASPSVVAAYLPVRSECDPSALAGQVKAAGRVLALPAVIDHADIVFREHRPGGPLVAGRFGTLAPPPEAPAVRPDLIVLPLVGFDRTGTRLGHGAGYYDRAIAALMAAGRRPLLLGLAFAAQEVETIPHEPHDARLDWVVTENETLDFRGRAEAE